MQLEKDDYFVVINGVEIGTVIHGVNPKQILSSIQNNEPMPAFDVSPKYDKTHEGIIYKILEHTPGSPVAAVEVIYDSFGFISREDSWMGKRFSLNIDELHETMTVTSDYVNVLIQAIELEYQKLQQEEKKAMDLLKMIYSYGSLNSTSIASSEDPVKINKNNNLKYLKNVLNKFNDDSSSSNKGSYNSGLDNPID